ncbi:hypothetical protein KR044_010843 [Drosophila immigrans]|nr:hypothetical protein KR044_010843 [Drosophila immigrans]
MATNRDKENCLSFDEFLPYMGDFGLYQKRLIIYLIPFFFLWAFIYFAQIFLIIVPNDHWCRIAELQQLSKDEQLQLGIPKSKGVYDKCFMYDTNYTEALERNLTKADDSWAQKPCEDWNYNRQQVPYESIATQFNWVCQYDHLGPYSVTINFLGSVVGGLIFGYAADHWGRLPTVMLSNLCGLIGGILSAFCKSFLWFSITRFVVGLAMDNCCIPMYVLMMECLHPKCRPAVTNFCLTLCFLPAACLLPWIALWCNDWRLFSIVISAPLVICLLMYFCLQESPRWLISVGKIAEALRIIEYIAKVNGKTIPKETMASFEKCCILEFNEEQLKRQYTLLDLFKSYRMALITLDLVVIWMIIALVYDAHVRAIIEIGTDVFMTFSVASAVELPACLVPFFLLDFVGRKCMCILAFIGCAVGSLCAAFLLIEWQMLMCAIFGRFCVTITFNIGVQWAAEILPTVVRGQGIAFIHIMGFVASLLSPFVVYTKIYSPSNPMSIIGGLSLCAAVLVLFLPDTTKIDLPLKPEDTETLSRNQNICILKNK